jgi:hypothetical protein
MQIVFDRAVVNELRERYTVLELESFEAGVNGETLTAFCVVPVEKLAFMDLSKLDEQVETHNAFLTALRAKRWQLVLDCYNSVRGMFGGELDSFYSEIVTRANLNLGD